MGLAPLRRSAMIRRKRTPMGEKLRVTLIANAGLLLEYQGITLMMEIGRASCRERV